MNADQHRNVARFLDSFDDVVKGVVGYASEGRYCFTKTAFTDEERQAIADSLRKRLAFESEQVEFVGEDAELLRSLFELAICGVTPKK